MNQPQSLPTAPGWLWRMAWRDSRRSRQRLLLFMSSIVLGIAALVAINSFGDNLARSIDEQAQELLGADLTASYSKEQSVKTQQLLRTLGNERAFEVAFPSMVVFPKSQGLRLAQVKALEGNFPYYGNWETQPASAVARFRQAMVSKQRVALVEDNLLIQFGAQVGDSVKIGNLTFLVAGRVMATPGQAAIASTVAPAVFIPYPFLAQTGLVQTGSRINYKYYYHFTPTTNVEALAGKLRPRFDKLGISTDTVVGRKKQTGRSFDDLTKYLNLVAFVALLLGCVGVVSAVHLYVKEKVQSVAILRTLGTSGRQAFLIYLIQTAVMGLVGAVVGAMLGSAIQLLLPRVFGSFLPVTVDTTISWPAVGQGIGTGLLISVLFALLPLLVIRKVSPLRVLRANYNDDTASADVWQWAVYAVIVLAIVGFAYLQIRNWQMALSFTAGLGAAFAVLAGMAQLLILAVRKFFPVSWSYVWRQSLANLYRPQNQTLILVVSIGLGAFLIATLYLTQSLLLGRVQLSASGNQPNMVLFDIQNEQKDGVKALVEQYKMPVIQQVPVVTMRLLSINSRSIETIRKDTATRIPEGALTREYRATYRDSLIGSEKLISGRPPYEGSDGLPHISVDDDYFGRLKLKLGDKLTFNVQGTPIETVVGGTRKVDWQRVQTNFLVVFPTGVLEQAPQFQVLMTRTPNNQQAALFQRALVSRFPNVSAIDLGLILKTLDEILGKISFIIRFMALFSIITGLLVLSSSVIISKYQRIQESVLLRTLGASRNQILQITLIEYLFLGLLASLSGILMSLLAAWALARFVFDVPFTPAPAPLLVITTVVTVLTMVIGLFNSRDVLVRPPLEVLRADA